MTPSRSGLVTVVAMVSAWVLVTLAALAALCCGYGAHRLARRPPEARR